MKNQATLLRSRMGNCGDILPMLSSIIIGLGGKESNVVTCPLGARLPFVQKEETVLPPRAICDTDVCIFFRCFCTHRKRASPFSTQNKSTVSQGLRGALGGVDTSRTRVTLVGFYIIHRRNCLKGPPSAANKSEGWSDFTHIIYIHIKHTSSQSPKMSNWDQRTDLFCAPYCYLKFWLMKNK